MSVSFYCRSASWCRSSLTQSRDASSATELQHIQIQRAASAHHTAVSCVCVCVCLLKDSLSCRSKFPPEAFCLSLPTSLFLRREKQCAAFRLQPQSAVGFCAGSFNLNGWKDCPAEWVIRGPEKWMFLLNLYNLFLSKRHKCLSSSRDALCDFFYRQFPASYCWYWSDDFAFFVFSKEVCTVVFAQLSSRNLRCVEQREMIPYSITCISCLFWKCHI